MKTRLTILTMIISVFMATSCQKTDSLENESVEAADDAAFSEAVFDDAVSSLEIVSALANVTAKSASITDTCPQVTITSSLNDFWPCTIEIDYGTGCTGLYDIIRSGKIIITLSDPRQTVGSERTVTFEDYYVNGAGIEGTLTVTNTGMNNDGNYVFAVNLTGGKITFTDGKEITREFTRQREYIQGYDTWNPWDDVCLITGWASGTTLSGLTYTHTITNALEWQAACRFIVSGTIEFDLEGIEPFELDYGDGECDAYATLSRGDETKEIILQYCHPRYTGN